MSWERKSLGSFVEAGAAEIQTGPFGTQLRASDYVPEGVPVINVRNIGYGDLRSEKLEYVPEELADRMAAHVLESGDIVFGRKGAVDRHLLVTPECAQWMQGSDCIRLRLSGDVLIPRYVSYAMLEEPHKKWMLAQCGNKATMASLNHDVIKRIEIFVPPVPVQREIVGVLTAYDDLIENNHRRIKLLEDAARLLYREWFVHLRFPGHEHVKIVDGVPEGWGRKPLREVATLNYGKALKEDLRKPGPFPVYGSSGIVGSHAAWLSAGPGIIVGRKGNVGSVYWSPVGFFAIDTVYFINVEQSSLYLYYALQHAQFISTDVAVPGLNREFAYSRPILVPSHQVLADFHETVTPMHQQIEKLTLHSDKLRETRDLLLPRLMRGDLAV